MSRSTVEFLRHIQQELTYILSRSESLTYEEFSTNADLTRAFVRSLEIVGEACKNIPDEVRYTYLQFDWKGFAQLRDRLIHHYWGIDYEIIWNAIQTEIPDNKAWIDFIIEQEESNL
ncbi:HepT-like ribonuclease domain-containing protein [Larkinella rosea]|uniref:DUF86 domain-containing protein n=1 Tax=Larkinella rosea TaxID=2025312 RepID=A0A3P1BD85_9BACT|nr:HepT-like ribonuclease domain-containing protein [Larkinella rosea]RRA98742.1 DUF86 domain-containing protein [Larkinella rosea]